MTKAWCFLQRKRNKSLSLFLCSFFYVRFWIIFSRFLLVVQWITWLNNSITATIIIMKSLLLFVSIETLHGKVRLVAFLTSTWNWHYLQISVQQSLIYLNSVSAKVIVGKVPVRPWALPTPKYHLSQFFHLRWTVVSISNVLSSLYRCLSSLW